MQSYFLIQKLKANGARQKQAVIILSEEKEISRGRSHRKRSLPTIPPTAGAEWMPHRMRMGMPSGPSNEAQMDCTRMAKVARRDALDSTISGDSSPGTPPVHAT